MRSRKYYIFILFLIISLLVFVGCKARGALKERTQDIKITGDNVFISEPILESNTLEKRKFDSNAWKKATLHERRMYSEDIYLSNVLIGKTKEQILELLGPWDGEFKNSNRITYRIDSGAKLENGTTWYFSLLIDFDVSGLVIKVKISS